MASSSTYHALPPKPQYTGFSDDDSQDKRLHVSRSFTSKEQIPHPVLQTSPAKETPKSRKCQHLSGSMDSDDGIVDLSYWKNYLGEDSPSPSLSPRQPLTPHGEGTPSRSRFHENDVPVIVIDSSEDDGTNSESSAHPIKRQTRLQKRPTNLVVIENSDDWKDGLVMDSIEKDRSIAPERERQGTAISRSSTSVPDTDHARSWPVRRITGERIWKDHHEYRIEWDGDYGASHWVPAEDCSCPDVITDWRLEQEGELFAARQAGRLSDVSKLERLANADREEIESAVLPVHPRWQCRRREATGRFAAPGTRDSRLEMVRAETIAPFIRENTAIPRNGGIDEGDEDCHDGEIAWVSTQVRPKKARPVKKPKTGGKKRIGIVGYGYSLEADKLERRQRDEADEVLAIGLNSDMERKEIARRREQDETEARAAIEHAATCGRRRLAKQRRRLDEKSLKRQLAKIKRMLRERQEEKQEARRLKKEARLEKARRVNEAITREEKMRRQESLLVDEAIKQAEILRRQREREARQLKLIETVKRAGKPIQSSASENENPASQESTLPITQAFNDVASVLQPVMTHLSNPESTPASSQTASAAPSQPEASPCIVFGLPSVMGQHRNPIPGAGCSSLVNNGSKFEQIPLTQSRAMSVSSEMSIGTRFVKSREIEALAKSNEGTAVVRNSFRGTMGPRHAESLIYHSWGLSKE